jgi:lipopolysaccharide/colanic/teichoic acid biosynthesis glycosyltransferase
MSGGLYARFGKRGLDLVVTGILVVVLSPLIFVVAVLILIALGRPIFFVQTRAGLGGRPFQIRKFRTMKEGLDPEGRALSDAVRLTSFGHVIRSWSLDELPTLLNVLRGDMSMIGPRPLLMQYLPLYTPEEARRHSVRPGITGLAQVSGRNALTWEERFALDVWYVDHLGLLLDGKVLGKTLLAVLNREGVSASGHVTMPRFTGHQN